MHVVERREPLVKLPKPEGAEWAAPFKEIRTLNYRHDGKGYLKEGYHHVFVLPADGGTPRQLTRARTSTAAPLPGRPTANPCLSRPTAIPKASTTP